MVQFCVRRRFQRRVFVLRRCIRRLLDRIFMSCLGKTVPYRMLPHSIMARSSTPASPSTTTTTAADESSVTTCKDVATHRVSVNRDMDSDLVSLKIALLGDSHIGKTCFMTKYVGGHEEQGREEEEGLSFLDKTLLVKGARISYSIWEVEGDMKSKDHIPIACKDSVAILFMFDLTSRCTLNSVIRWYKEARKWNQTAIPILIGTKFDDFIQLPIDLQWTIASEVAGIQMLAGAGHSPVTWRNQGLEKARAYARALNATLFFSSATYNINVNKVFKFITAKLFDLPWTVERNLTLGEPIIDF